MKEPIDIEEFLARMQPPSIPDETFIPEYEELFRVSGWKRNYVATILACLTTIPDLHANGIRLDWLQRLVIAKAEGKRKPKIRELAAALNLGLEKAGVLRLEDPIEDLFCEIVATRRGNFRIFPGQWETAGPYTQTLLAAFEQLPGSQFKTDVLESVYGILRISDMIAARSDVHRQTESGGVAQGEIRVPGEAAINRISTRVKFTDRTLEALDIRKEALTPYFLSAENYPYVSDREVGETPLEFHPFLETPNGIIVVSPNNLSIAARAVMIHAAVEGGVSDLLQQILLHEQEIYAERTGFWPTTNLKLSRPNEFGFRASICEFEEGRFLQVIQLPTTFDGFPRNGFGIVRRAGEEANKFLGTQIEGFWKFAAKQENGRQFVSVLLTSGWGAPHSIFPAIDESKVPANWLYFHLSFAEAAVLGACENGKFQDICRLLKQEQLLENAEFHFQNANGLTNLFGFWRVTDGNLIPEYMSDMEPPCNLMIPTDDLYAPRIEAARKQNLLSLPFPDGSHKLVQHTDFEEYWALDPVFGSLEDLSERRLVGAVAHEEYIWWIEAVPDEDSVAHRQYRIWQAALHWIAAVGRQVARTYPKSFPKGIFQTTIIVPIDDGLMRMDRSSFNSTPLAKTVQTQGQEEVRITNGWFQHLWRPENDAEIELTAAILESVAARHAPLERDVLREAVRSAIPSRDWRWLHASTAERPIDRLRATGLVSGFQEIPWSATTLAKCCSIWTFRDRSNGLRIEGEQDCSAFVLLYARQLLGTLIERIRRFDCRALITLAADGYQAARLEQSQWRATILALRAIHGAEADSRAFERQSNINAVQRAAKAICEVAACESPTEGGLKPSLTDFHDLCALVLLLVGNGDLLGAIKSGLIAPEIRISPAGDLLSERSVFETTLRPGAEWLNERALNEAAETYKEERKEEAATPEKPGELQLPAALKDAIRAEYGVPAEAFFRFQFATVEFAAEREQAVLFLKRSELVQAMSERMDTPVVEVAQLCERLSLSNRPDWYDLSGGIPASSIDLTRFDRPISVINRPLLCIDAEEDPTVVLAPAFVSDSTMYSFSGLMEGSLQEKYWVSKEAISYAGARAHATGEEFETDVAERLKELGLKAWSRCKLSWALNQKVDPSFGDIDVLAVDKSGKTVWVIEAKNLKLCRTIGEVAARLTEYRGLMVKDSKGREKPDKLLRHLNRVRFLRENCRALCQRLDLDETPEVRGLLIVDSPQPMNFHMIEKIADTDSTFLDQVDKFDFCG
ncbi:MAG: hypothetical protein JJ959_09170 [Nisaea sp.]|uniref:hypothetical protein n=1 Tax=Nisaea sp. TaxID=2024842 RepID=UPI001AFF1B20|nr:hypothetical protein [Nisaea sp.]MBO6560696.1 hypothetical protein [Nisaea sp.]